MELNYPGWCEFRLLRGNISNISFEKLFTEIFKNDFKQVKLAYR